MRIQAPGVGFWCRQYLIGFWCRKYLIGSWNHPQLVTFDAFGTLYTPIRPVHELYWGFARSHGLTLEPSAAPFRKAFQRAFKQVSIRYPNYGKKVLALLDEWWGYIIRDTLGLCGSDPRVAPFVSVVLAAFKTAEVNQSFEDVVPLLRVLAERGVSVGVASNTDRNVIATLHQLGIGAWIAPTEIHLSYDLGVEKPDAEFFRRIRPGGACYWHVGDELVKDFMAAYEAGWSSILVDRCNVHGYLQEGEEVRRVNGRQYVVRHLGQVALIMGLPPRVCASSGVA